MSKVTLKDVAKQAGVSVASVSNVLNGNTSKVSEETAKRIVLVAEQMRYTKNSIAAALKSGMTNTILILLPQLDYDDLTRELEQDHPFFSDFFSGIEKAASRSYLPCSFVRVSEGYEIDSILDGPSPKGVIAIGNLSDSVLERISSWPLETIVVDNINFFDQFPLKPNLLNYHINDREMGSLAIKHLLKCGHTNIVLLSGYLEDSGVYFERYQGIVEEVQSIQKEVKLSLIETEVSINAVQKEFLKIKKTINENDATAVLCMADVLAIGCMREAIRDNIKIPDNLSLMGMDNLKLLNYLPYQLTTINQDIVNRGFNAVQMIIDKHHTYTPSINVTEGETTKII